MPDQTNPLTPDIVNAIARDPDSPYYPTRITVFCDRLDCGTEFTGEFMVSTAMTRDERLGVARKHLVDKEGWAHTDDGDDLCRAHAPATTQPEACGKCRTPFDPEDTKFDGRARHRDTPWCRRCVDFCHDTEIADHRCVICA